MSDVSPFTRIAQESPEAAALVGQIVMAGYNSYADSSQKLIDSLERTIAEREAELAIIKFRIDAICNERYAPHPGRVVDALFVSQHEINAYLAAEGGAR